MSSSLSRLDRLLLLLDTGSSQAVRSAAARQIAQIAAKSINKDVAADAGVEGQTSAVHVWHTPSSDWSEAMAVVGKILPYLHSKTFDTRLAAANALSQICTLVPQWKPSTLPLTDEVKSENLSPSEFPSFSVSQLLATAPLLLASSGKEFSKPTVLGSASDVAKARKEAMGRLGLGFLDGVGGDDLSGDLEKELVLDSNDDDDVKMEDVKTEEEYMKAEPPTPSSPTPGPSGTFVKTETLAYTDEPTSSTPEANGSAEGLSARERNRLKRKRKTGNSAFVNAMAGSTAASMVKPVPKVRVVEGDSGPKAKPAVSPTPSDTAPPAEKVIIDPQKGGEVRAKEKAALSEVFVNDNSWVWTRVVQVLEVDLLSPNWEVRHGAALGLREIIKTQGLSGGMKDGRSTTENEIAHENWCNGLAVKFLLVFVLDRFSDFVSDQMVAPVRETVSQTMASLLLHMPRSSILDVHRVFSDMVFQDSSTVNGNEPKMNGSRTKKNNAPTHVWQVRHSGLLGMKYEVAVRKDLLDPNEEKGDMVLKGVLDAALLGLGDPDDDVRSVAASCLIPIVKELVERLPESLTDTLLVLWGCLADMKDDLGTSVSAVMELLGKLVTYDLVTQILVNPTSSIPLTTLAPTLFPFFRHTISTVRLAVVNTLFQFLSVPSVADDWVSPQFLCLLFQNLILEERFDIRDSTFKTWKLTLQHISQVEGRLEELVTTPLMNWFTILMSPLGSALDQALFFQTARAQGAHNVDKPMMMQDFSLVSQESVLRGRIAGSKAVAFLLSVWPVATQKIVFEHYLTFYDRSSSVLQRSLCATIVQEWAIAVDQVHPEARVPLPTLSPLASELSNRLLTFIESTPPPSYHEMASDLTRLLTESRNLLSAFSTEMKVPHSKVPTLPSTIDLTGDNPGGFSLSTAAETAGATFDKLKSGLGRAKKRELGLLEERRQKVLHGINRYNEIKKLHDVRVMAASAAAVVALRTLPDKLNPVIHGVMNGTKFEENLDLQERFAAAVVAFVGHCAPLALAVRMNPAQKIVKNICTFICSDDTLTPVFADSMNLRNGITSNKKPIISNTATKRAAIANGADVEDVQTDQIKNAPAKLQRRGALMALANLGEGFGADLLSQLPKLWECMSNGLIDAYSSTESSEAEDPLVGQAVIDNLTVIQGIASHLHPSLLPRILELFPLIILALQSNFAVIRRSAARCFATLSDFFTNDAMQHVVEHVVPLLGDSKKVSNRQGAMEAIAAIVVLLEIKVLPYVIFLIVPVLGRMSDSDDDVRYCATNTFASLVKMVPLEAGLPDPPNFSEDLLQRRETERQFLTQLLDGSKVQPYEIPVKINAELRRYQQDGVNWLAFLSKYQLHGILCDDMGLGKTLQSICILASKHHERAEKHKATKSPDSTHMPSIIICPPTLTGHWYHEILKYANNLRPVMYCGPHRERMKLTSTLVQYDVIITSYDVVRNDVGHLAPIDWHYCILDEGHVIKNDKTKLTKAVKTIKAHHRLILSGTPIQNNVLELWSLFDFLMPGFLGTESSFNERFGKPILANRDSKAGAKTAEAAALALESLHKQVLPFLLRRLKEDVLSDLPPKIIQDYYCDLSDLQKSMYDDFTSSQAADAAKRAVKGGGQGSGGQHHVFQSLQYLRKLCNHPALVLKDQDAIQKAIKKYNIPPSSSGIRDIQHAPKIQALRQLLLDCGIGCGLGNDADSQELSTTESSISQHRVLIFCQMKDMINMIETDLFQALMPSVTYMRLDGTTDPNKRHAIVQTFNSDPSIDCLLLTTQVGGLGLTLTGADTVIFVEHDWNPMKDLQAMDRAHRLGQKKVVNVYRLVTRGTLEEKIMGLQRFKLNIANSVITQQNSGLSSMDTDLVLDLFKRTTEEEDAAAARKKKAAESTGPASQKNVLEGLEDLPAEEEYEGLDLSTFMDSLNR